MSCSQNTNGVFADRQAARTLPSATSGRLPRTTSGLELQDACTNALANVDFLPATSDQRVLGERPAKRHRHDVERRGVVRTQTQLALRRLKLGEMQVPDRMRP